MTTDPEYLTFDHVLFYGREYNEVLEMFGLSEANLAGKKILDCPSGPDSFVAEAHARGFDVTGCDPLYAKSGIEILIQGEKDIRFSWDESKKYPAQMGNMDIDDFHRRKLAALDRFGKDYDAGCAEGRYQAASLPTLPFEDKTFDLVISANMLFTYSSTETGGLLPTEIFDLDFHLRSVRELIRVSRKEVRLYPVMTNHAKKHLHPYAAQIVGKLAADGIKMNFIESSYSQTSCTGRLMLVIDCE